MSHVGQTRYAIGMLCNKFKPIVCAFVNSHYNIFYLLLLGVFTMHHDLHY